MVITVGWVGVIKYHLSDQKLAAHLGELEMLDITGSCSLILTIFGRVDCHNSDFAKRLCLNNDAGKSAKPEYSEFCKHSAV